MLACKTVSVTGGVAAVAPLGATGGSSRYRIRTNGSVAQFAFEPFTGAVEADAYTLGSGEVAEVDVHGDSTLYLGASAGSLSVSVCVVPL